MSTCPEACFTADLYKPVVISCGLEPRIASTKKYVFYACSFAFPTGSESAIIDGIDDAITAGGVITTTGAITGETIDDPSVVSVDIATCIPDLQFITGRTVTFQDYSAQDVDDDGAASPFFEIDRVKQIKANRNKLNVGYIDCNGKLYNCVDNDGKFLQASILVYKKKNQQNVSGTKMDIHYHEYKITFNGDPWASKPIADLSTSTATNIINLIG